MTTITCGCRERPPSTEGDLYVLAPIAPACARVASLGAGGAVEPLLDDVPLG